MRSFTSLLSRSLLALVPGLLASESIDAQTDLARSRRIVYGLVHDSVGRAPLAGAIVQLVATGGAIEFGRTVQADDRGQFAFDSIPDGKYMIGFFHPMLDSLGLEPLLRAVTIERQVSQRTDLAIPSPARIRAAVCGGEAGAGAIVMGIVRDASGGAPPTGATVVGEWSELAFANNGIVSRTPRRVTTTKDGGWFALCNMPSPGTIVMLASRGADSTDRIEVMVPADGFLRRELYLGAASGARSGAPSGAATVGAASIVSGGDSATAATRAPATTGRLSGTVVAALGGAPLAGAQVSIAKGPATRTNENGEWTLTNAPIGTRTIEVRAVGHYPERRSVDVIAGAPPVRVAMSTLKSVLETVKVTASALTTNMLGFQERRKTMMGRFITEEDIIRKAPRSTSDLFRSFPGVTYYGHDADAQIKMRSIFDEENGCDPVFFLNGSPMRGIGVSELDQFVMPREIVGVEVYQQGTVPAQFQAFGSTGCGAIVFWTTYGRTRERKS